MRGNSHKICSTQSSLHKDLLKVYNIHSSTSYKKPIAEHSRADFEHLWPKIESAKSLILDSGCGNGESSIKLGEIFPNSTVVGVDKSKHRLIPMIVGKENVILFRANLVDFWRLLAQTGIQLERHYMLYPNPWPKPQQLKRRWYAHPVFPCILALGGKLEVRSNWKVYIDDFSFILMQSKRAFHKKEITTLKTSLTPFEKKYRESAHKLFQLNSDLSFSLSSSSALSPKSG